MNIGEWVRKWASIRPDKIAIICEETALTYGQLASRVNRLANLIHKKGIKKGDRVAVLLYNSKEYVEIVLALSTTGAILVPLNFRLSGEELECNLRKHYYRWTPLPCLNSLKRHSIGLIPICPAISPRKLLRRG
jgi:acyl-CoA synthetase (AMP-forming)/AMP-acid ligase II